MAVRLSKARRTRASRAAFTRGMWGREQPFLASQRTKVGTTFHHRGLSPYVAWLLPMVQANGLRHFRPLNLAKSVSEEQSSAAFSMAKAAKCASEVRLP